MTTRWRTYHAYSISVAFSHTASQTDRHCRSLTGQQRGVYESRGLQDEDGLHELSCLLFHTQGNQQWRTAWHHRHTTQLQWAQLALRLQRHDRNRPALTMADLTTCSWVKLQPQNRWWHLHEWRTIFYDIIKVQYSGSKLVSGLFGHKEKKILKMKI